MGKEVSRQYGVLIEDQDKLRDEVVHNLNIGRNVDEVLRALEALQNGELCPIDWEEGMPTLGKA